MKILANSGVFSLDEPYQELVGCDEHTQGEKGQGGGGGGGGGGYW